MKSEPRRRLRRAIAERVSGRNPRRAILLGGALVVLTFASLMLLRSYEGRPLLYNEDGTTVRQTKVDCPPAWRSLTADYNNLDQSAPPEIALCNDSGRAKVVATVMFTIFAAAVTFGLSRIPEPGKGPVQESAWDSAIATARRRQQEDGRRASSE